MKMDWHSRRQQPRHSTQATWILPWVESSSRLRKKKKNLLPTSQAVITAKNLHSVALQKHNPNKKKTEYARLAQGYAVTSHPDSWDMLLSHTPFSALLPSSVSPSRAQNAVDAAAPETGETGLALKSCFTPRWQTVQMRVAWKQPESPPPHNSSQKLLASREWGRRDPLESVNAYNCRRGGGGNWGGGCDKGRGKGKGVKVCICGSVCLLL